MFDNPSIGEAGEAAGRAHGFMEALREAAAALGGSDRGKITAAQQKKLDDEERQRQFENQLEMHKLGAIPLEGTDQNGRPTLMRGGNSGDAGGAVDQSRIRTLPDGSRWVVPDQKALTPEQQATNTRLDSGQLLEALNHGGVAENSQGMIPDPALADVKRYRADQNGNLTDTGSTGTVRDPEQSPGAVVNAGGRQVYMPTDEEKAAAELKQKTAQAEALRHLSEMPIPKDLADMLGIKPGDGQGATFKDIATAHHELLNEKPAKYTYNHFMDDSGRLSATRFPQDGAPEIWGGMEQGWTTLEAGARIGPKRKDPDAAGAAKPSAAQLRLISERKATGLKQAETAYSKAIEQGQNRLNTLKLHIPSDPAKQSADNKQQVAALTAEVSDQRKAAADALLKAKQATQDEYEESLANLGLSGGHFSYGDQTQPRAAQQPQGARGGRGGTNAPAAPAKGQQAQVAEGTIIRNPKTGVRLVMRGGQWAPVR